MTAVQPQGGFGAIEISGNQITFFPEKPQGGGWINGGFFVLTHRIMQRIEGGDTLGEKTPFESLARGNQLPANFLEGFWQPMDTLRDKNVLKGLWVGGNAPWKVWGKLVPQATRPHLPSDACPTKVVNSIKNAPT